MSEIIRRKSDHIDICTAREVNAHYNYWDDLHLIHNALPEVDLDGIDLSLELFGKRLAAPVVISGMTGGSDRARKINARLAHAAAEFQIGMGLGSQRAALEHPKLAPTFNVVKEYDVPLILGNIGAPQLIAQQQRPAFSLDDARMAMEMVDADVLAVHLNFLQELVQPEGECNATGCLEALEAFAKGLPVVAKETGAGISSSLAILLQGIGVAGIDIGGVGGTSFAAVEAYRAAELGDGMHEQLGQLYWDWGIPTPATLAELRTNPNYTLPTIASGGIRNGLDLARAIVLGATAGGVARRLLKPALESAEAVVNELQQLITELRGALFLIGASTIASAQEQEVRITGKLREWLGG